MNQHDMLLYSVLQTTHDIYQLQELHHSYEPFNKHSIIETLHNSRCAAAQFDLVCTTRVGDKFYVLSRATKNSQIVAIVLVTG